MVNRMNVAADASGAFVNWLVDEAIMVLRRGGDYRSREQLGLLLADLRGAATIELNGILSDIISNLTEERR
jgi:hypothetical protein